MFLKSLGRCRRGSLLIEALLAVVILSVSITLIIQAMISSARAMDYSADYAAAAALLEYKMQELIVAGSTATNHEEGPMDDFDGKYRYKITSEDSTDDASQVKVVDVAVEWQSGHKENSISLTSFLLKDEE